MQKVDDAAITLMVNHGHNEIMDMCNRFILMHQGCIVEEGTAKEVEQWYRSDLLGLPDYESPHLIEQDI